MPVSGQPLTPTPVLILAALFALLPLFAAAFFGEPIARRAATLPAWLRIVRPAVLSVPYVLVTVSTGTFRWSWFALYLLLPVAVAALLLHAKAADPAQRGTWRDFLILGLLGLAVDLRWFEPAWPPHLAAFNKILLLDAGIYGFLILRQLSGTGFDLRLRPRDLRTGLRELAFYTPIALALGLTLHFLHLHAHWPSPLQVPVALLFTFVFIAIPEELFFRGWLQNLLERRLQPRLNPQTARRAALFLTAILFGLSHFNKRAAHFNWRYVLLAAVAGLFYGRAWRQDRRVAASAITHTCVDTLWSIWLR
jgi:uncharacterized protein